MKKTDRIIDNIREMMTANSPSQSGGFGSNASPSGPNAGFDPVLNFVRRKRNNGVDLRTVKPDYRRWLKSVEDITNNK